MTFQAVTLGSMGRLDARIAHAADAVVTQGGDWDATYAYLSERLDGEDLVDAYEIALAIHRLFIVTFPGPIKAENGYDLVRQLRKTLQLPATAPPRRSRWTALRTRVGA
jgi:hypothetical protein